jgi:hypothetical protein
VFKLGCHWERGNESKGTLQKDWEAEGNDAQTKGLVFFLGQGFKTYVELANKVGELDSAPSWNADRRLSCNLETILDIVTESANKEIAPGSFTSAFKNVSPCYACMRLVASRPRPHNLATFPAQMPSNLASHSDFCHDELINFWKGERTKLWNRSDPHSENVAQKNKKRLVASRPRPHNLATFPAQMPSNLASLIHWSTPRKGETSLPL